MYVRDLAESHIGKECVSDTFATSLGPTQVLATKFLLEIINDDIYKIQFVLLSQTL